MMRSASAKRMLRAGIVSVLDIGSSKFTCMIARATPCERSAAFPRRTHKLELVGIGHHQARGIKGGIVTDLDAAEHAVRLAVDAAERMAGLTVESLIVNLSGGRMRSTTIPASIDLGGKEITERDVAHVVEAGMTRALGQERTVVHAFPTLFNLDGDGGIIDPCGMVGDALSVAVHVVTADSSPLANMELCVNRAHLAVETMVATPYASGLSVLVDDEMNIGSAVVDFGGGTTSIGIFHQGKFVHGDVLPVGGHHVTLDIARGLSIAVEDAERLKVMHGSALSLDTDQNEMIAVNQMGAETGDALNIPRALLSRIVSARIDETLELVRDRIAKSGYGSVIGKRIVLTGGASQLPGLPEAMRRVMGRTPRLGRPMGISKLPENAKGPAFAAAAGLMIYPQMMENAGASLSGRRIGLNTKLTGTLGKIGSWLSHGF